MPSEAYGFDDNKLRVAISAAVDEAVNKIDFMPKINERFLQLHPVGTVIITLNPINPGEYYGFGTWEQFSQGRVLVGVDPNDSDFTINKSGGSKFIQSHTHTYESIFRLRSSKSPSSGNINEDVWKGNDGKNFSYMDINSSTKPKDLHSQYYKAGTSGTGHETRITIGGKTGSAGDGGAGNLQPYTTAYFWRRTA